MTVDERSQRRADTAASSRAAPVVVMTYTGSGSDQLQSALSAFPELTCTQGTGILPLCHHAVAAWETVDGGAGGELSALAGTSVRALCGALVTTILARAGGNRWCEFTSAPSAVAETFTRLYPKTSFLMLHRRADAVLRAILGASRWGLEGQEFAPFVSAHPASPLAALATYWVAHTAQLLEFEHAYPDVCLRIRLEDLTTNLVQTLPAIGEFLCLDSRDVSPWLNYDAGSEPYDAGPSATGLPLERIQGPLLAQVNELQRRLGYPPVTAIEL